MAVLDLLQRYEVIVAVLVAVVGWWVTHWQTIRAQRRAFLDQITNDARSDVTSAIREYQEWLAAAAGVPVDAAARLEANLDLARPLLERLALLLPDRRALGWARRLEEYEILFPQTSRCRQQLLERHRQIEGSLDRLRSAIYRASDATGLSDQIGAACDQRSLVWDQIALTEDLRVHLANHCLRLITGNRVPARQPLESTLPRLIVKPDGAIEVRATDASSA